MNRKISMVWERLKYGLSLLPHFYSWRGTVMRQKFYHNVNYWFGCPKKCMSGGSQVVTTALKAATGVLCGVEFSRNLGQKCGCDREDLWLKVSHPSATYYDSLCWTRVCKKEKGNKGTKRKINLFSLIHIFPNVILYPFQKYIFSAPSSSLWNFKGYPSTTFTSPLTLLFPFITSTCHQTSLGTFVLQALAEEDSCPQHTLILPFTRSSTLAWAHLFADSLTGVWVAHPWLWAKIHQGHNEGCCLLFIFCSTNKTGSFTI